MELRLSGRYLESASMCGESKRERKSMRECVCVREREREKERTRERERMREKGGYLSRMIVKNLFLQFLAGNC